MNKKAFMQEIGLVFVFLFILSLVLLVAYQTNNSINTVWQNMSNIPEESKTIMNNYNTRIPAIFDGIFIFLVIGFIIVLVMTAFAIRSHPIFAMFGIIILIILGSLTVYFSNSFNSIATSSSLVSSANEFNAISFIMNNFPTVMIILGFVFVIILFAKQDGGGL